MKNNSAFFIPTLVIYNLGTALMFYFLLFHENANSNLISTGVILFMINLFLPAIIFVRQQAWGKYAMPLEEEMVSPIMKGLKNFKNSNNVERIFAISYVFWLFMAGLVILYGWLFT